MTTPISSASNLEATASSLRRVLVVGVSASFGPELVRGFAAQGARVMGTTRSGLAPQIGALAELHSLDLGDPAAMDSLVSRMPDFGALDVLIFAAGMLPGRSLEAYDDELMQEVMRTNFTGQAALLRRLLPHLSPGAQVWLVSSISAERGSFDPVYAASKAALVGFVKSLAVWLAPALRINALAPALIQDSGMFAAMSPERRAHHLRTTPTGRLTEPGEVAGVLLNLCEPVWSNLNGQVIHLNGGAHV